MAEAARKIDPTPIETHPHVKRQCDRLRPRLKGAESELARARHELGLLVGEVAASKKFGEDAVGQIKAELGIARRTLYRCSAVATAFPRAEFSALLSRVNRHGLPLTWTHFVALSELPPVRRLALAEKALTDGLTARQLKRMVERRDARRRDRALRMAEHAQALITRVQEWENQLVRSSAASSARAARSMKEARKSYGHLLLVCQRLVARIDAGLERNR